MSLTDRFIPHSAYLSSGTWINQVESTGPQSGVANFEEASGSQTDREFVAARHVDPKIPIATSDLSLLSTIGIAGLALANASPSLTVYGRQLPVGALPASIASTVHLSLVVTDGLIVPVAIHAAHNTVAKLSLMCHPILGAGGGSQAAPFIYTAATTITSGAGQVANVYTAGPVKFTANSTAHLVNGVTDSGVDFGIGVLCEGDSGEVYCTHVSIISRMPHFSFATKDASLIATVGDGLKVTAFASYFRQVAVSGQRTAPATATHVSVSGTAGTITPGGLSLTHAQSGTATFTYTPALDSGTLITISTTAAIPTS